MNKPVEFLSTVPVLPCSDLQRSIDWYQKVLGFELDFSHEGYAGLHKGSLFIHLQAHSGTPDDPVNGGSVVKFFTTEIEAVYGELMGKGGISAKSLRKNTPWQTHEIGLFDPDRNAIFFVESLT